MAIQPGLLLFCTEANLWSIFILSTILYLLLMIGLFYISLPSLNNYQVVAIQPQHTITFCIVSNSLKYLYTFYYLYLFINDWVVIVFMPSLNKFGPFPCIWMPSTFVLLFLVSLEFSSVNFRAYFSYVKYVFVLCYIYLF